MAEVCYPPGLIGVDEAIRRLLSLAREKRPAVETVPLAEAGGRVLAQDVIAPMNVPPEANSAMDGYAFRHADIRNADTVPVSQRIPAGHVPVPLQPGTAVRIFTGAIIPAGADTVVMQEQCEVSEKKIPGKEIPEKNVRLLKVPEAGANVRAAGQDISCGSVVLTAGSRLSPPACGVLASLGITQVSVFRPLRVAILGTGDELLEPGEPWRSGAIYNSNRFLLAPLLSGWGCEVVDGGRVADAQEATEEALAKMRAADVDVIISSGGVSVGEEDHVKAALQEKGRLDFWKIAIKPGKPVAVGEIGGVPFLGLPGNPQSVFVTALLLARPFLLARQGQQHVSPHGIPVAAGFARDKAGDRSEYLRVQLQVTATGTELVPHSQQSSGALSSAVWADGLAVIPAGATVHPGQHIDFLPFSTLFMP